MATKMNKSEFIRSLPFSTPAAEVVEAGKKKGFDLSTEYVHTIRSNTRAAEKKATRTVARKESKPNGNNNSTAHKLLAYAAEIGYAEAIRLIQEARPKTS